MRPGLSRMEDRRHLSFAERSDEAALAMTENVEPMMLTSDHC